MNWTDIFGYFTNVLTFLIPRSWLVPRLIVHRAHNTADEPFLVWWHVNIRIEKRLFSSIDALHNCKVYLVINNRRAQLTWKTDIEAVETVTLQHGDDWRSVPVIARKDTPEDMMISAAPGRLPHFRVNAFEPRITDIEAILHNRNLQTLQPGEHFPTIEVHSGRDILKRCKLFLNIPRTNESNKSFIFR